MKELLTKWAKREPALCEEFKKVFTLRTEGYNKRILKDDFTGFGLAWIQWAIQEAIAARGWRYNLECYPITGICEGIVFFDATHTRRAGGNPAEALLSAYLETLEKAT